MEDILSAAGLAKEEILVFEGLLELGPSQTGQLVKRSGVPSSHVYRVLEKLQEKGLVVVTVSGGRKVFRALDPQFLENLYQEKVRALASQEATLLQAISRLKKARNSAKKQYDVCIYEGIRGIETFNESLLRRLKRGDHIMVAGTPRLHNPSLSGFFKDFHRRRSAKGIVYQVIKNASARRFIFIESFPHTQVRYTPYGMDLPTMFETTKDLVAIVLYDPFPLAFVVQNKLIAKSFRSYFSLLWKLAVTK